MTSCTDPRIGVLLHAYELHALSEDETERFERHLLKCDYCFEQVQAFASAATVLADDGDVKKLVDRQVNVQPKNLRSGNWFRRHLWPDSPLLLRPGLLYAVIVLMLIPTLRSLRMAGEPRIAPVQTAVFSQSRSAIQPEFSLSEGEYGVAAVVYREARQGTCYRVVVRHERGKYSSRTRLCNFDVHGTGHLALSLNNLPLGSYRLEIHEPEAHAAEPAACYYFTVTE